MSKYINCVDIRNNRLKNCIDVYYYENNERKITSFGSDWYFVISRKDYDTYKDNILKLGSRKINKIAISQKWARIYCHKYKLEVIDKCKSLNINLYESDLSITRRFWIDKYKENYHVAEANTYRILYFDIEVDDTTKGLEIGGSTILSWATIDSENNKRFESLNSCGNEKILLQKFMSHINSYDIVTGWNSFNYDIPYIVSRLAQNNMNAYIPVPHIDMMQRMIHTYRFDTKIKGYSLEYIANHFVGEKKIKRTTKIIEMYNNDFELFKKYNIRDVELLYEIDKACHVFETLLKQLYWCNIFPRDIGPKAKGLYVMLDSVILNKAHERDEYGPAPILNHTEWYEIDEQHAERYKLISKMLKEKKLKIKDLFDKDQIKDCSTKELQHKIPRADLKILEQYPDIKAIVKQYQLDETAYFYEGGYVIPPKTGIYPLVYSFDFKCFIPGTKIYTNKGYKSIENITTNDKVQSVDHQFAKIQTISKHKYSGMLKKITTTSEYSVTCTPNHKWPVFSEGIMLLKEAKDLQKNDKLLSPTQLKFKDNNLQNDLFELLGIFYFEATVCKMQHNSKISYPKYISNEYAVHLKILEKEKDFKNRITQLLLTYTHFEFEWTLEKHSTNNSIRLDIGNFLPNGKRNKKEVYEWLHSKFDILSTPEFLNSAYNMKKFIKGAFEADGSVNALRNTIVINSGTVYKKSRNARIPMIHNLLLRLNIVSNMSTCKTIHILEIYTNDSIMKYYQEINFISKRKQFELDKIISKLSTINRICLQGYTTRNVLNVENIKYSGYVYNLGLQDHSKPFYISNNLLTKNSLYPSIVRSFNIGFDSLAQPSEINNDLIKSFSGNYFKKSPESVLHVVIRELMEKRKEYKLKLLNIIESGGTGTIEYEAIHSDEVVVKELANCIHPDTLLTVYNKTLNKYLTTTIQKLYSLNDELYIQSYNFNNKSIEWKRITTIVNKHYSGKLIHLKFYHSNDVYCTPQHRLFGFEYANLANVNEHNRVLSAKRYSELKTTEKLNSQKIQAISISKYTRQTITIAKATSNFIQKDIQYLDIREYDLAALTDSKWCNLDIYYDSRKRRTRFVKTSCKQFDDYIYSATIQTIKGEKNIFNSKKYRISVTMSAQLWNNIKKLTYADLLKYKMSITLSYSRVKTPFLFTLTPDLLWTLGLWVAEGCAFYKTIPSVMGGLSIGNTNVSYINKVEKCCKDMNLKYTRSQYNNVLTIGINHAIMGEIMCKSFYSSSSHNAYTKCIPEWIYRIDKKLIAEFINGYCAGDAAIRAKHNTITTVSQHLAYQISDLIAHVYNIPVKLYDYSDDKLAPGYRIRYDKDFTRKNVYYDRFHDNITYETCKKIEKIEYSGMVYDIEVEDNHNFFIGNILSHNSCYGITGNRTGRYFSKGAIIPRSITLSGQKMLKLAAQFATEKGYDVIYGDTDSAMIATTHDIDVTEYLREFHKWLSKQLKLQSNIDTHSIVLEFDRLYKPFILLSKKSYTGRVLNQEGKKTDYTYSRGIDVVKSSTCPAVMKLQTELIKLLIEQCNNEEFFKKWIANIKATLFKSLTLPDDLIIHQKINKELNSYKNKPLAAVIAERKLKREGILISKEIEYIITGRTVVETINPKTNKKTTTNRLSGVEPELFDGTYDEKHYWENIILPCVSRFLDVIFPNTEWKKDYQYDDIVEK